MVTTTRPNVLSGTTIIGDDVKNLQREDLGKIEDLMMDIDTGQVAYAVLSFGGFLGIGDKLFAIPWGALILDAENQVFLLDVDKEMLEEAPGFDKDNWPKVIERDWLIEVYEYYGYEPYWQ